MKTTTSMVSMLTLALGSLGIAAARADTLDLTLIDPSLTVTQGTATVAVYATIFNPSTTDTIYLNGDASTTSSPDLAVDDTPFFANAPLSLAPGASSDPFELFDVNLSPTIGTGTYSSNSFSILGGPDGGTLTDFSDLADALFSITVSTPTAVAAPEVDSGSAMVAGLTLLAGWLAVVRSRRRAGRQAA